MPRSETGKRNKQRKRQEKKIGLLIEHWPQLFNKKEVRPVKIQIGEDLFKDAEERGIEITMKQINDGLAIWCNRLSYLHKCREGGPRFGLNGEEGEVAKEAIKMAKKKLRKLHDLHRARVAASEESPAGEHSPEATVS